MSQPRVYGMSSSGNCYKVRLLLEQLQQSLRMDRNRRAYRASRASRSSWAGIPTGACRLLEYEPGKYLAESDAILVYLADGSAFWPQQRLQRAQALQWMFFEQYSHEPYIAVARFICLMLPAQHERRADLPRLHERGYQALAVMEQHLARERFFVGDAYSIADIALYAYTHAAADGGFELQRFPAVTAWIARVESQPHFVPMPGVD
jgi:glutathione S-transferase